MARVSSKYFDDDYIQESPAGTVNGSNVSFTLSQAPAETDFVEIYVNGLFQRNGVDFTVSGTTVTMTTAPATESTIWATYWKQ